MDTDVKRQTCSNSREEGVNRDPGGNTVMGIAMK
jgi:hypothetical protein